MFLHILSVRDISLDANIGNINEDGSFPDSSRGSLPHHEVLYSLSKVVRA
ncbi:hypothetical protein HMPREF9004_0736 [Schaalia cardiffensis F0333]|uniref:Uncharacterized protein n=1 Tax=Schaalia cardiffensis F0333 TaxID=888050 RepID=N6X478_9ACTO|nr:hypothetical protein [Schaalia cardiffensis]ENO18526.1 hypothetical protein HMPREF9004_0736 [Schaalia cardiffensis F0333]